MSYKQRKTVPKTHEEAKMKIKYTTLFSRPLTQYEYEKVLKEFLKDCEIISKINPIYKSIN
jgi:hypothetical protein